MKNLAIYFGNRSYQNLQNRKNIFSLIIFASHVHVVVLKMLIVLGADLNLQDEDGYTPVMYAANFGESSCLRALISARANLNIQGGEGQHAALTEAAFYANRVCVKYLIAGGADLNLQNRKGDTPLIRAASAGKIHNLSALIRAGAKLNLKNKKGSTAVIESAKYGREACLKELLKTKAELDHQDYYGTALLQAIEERHDECAKALIEARADVTIRNQRDCTALRALSCTALEALSWDHDECTEALIEARAVRNQRGYTALEVASLYRKDMLCDLIRAEMSKNDQDDCK